MLPTRVKAVAVSLVPLLAACLLPAAAPHAGQVVTAELPLPAGAFARLGTSRLHHAQVTSALAFLPGDRTILSGSHSGGIRFWDTTTGKQTRLLPGPSSKLIVSPNGTMLASSAWDGRIFLRNVEKGEQTAVLSGHTGEVTSLAFAPGGKTLLSGGADRTIRLWDVSGATPLWSVPAPAAVRCVAFSDDGKRVASSGDDGHVCLWDAANGRKERALEGHTGKVTTVGFAVGGKTLVSGGWDHTARLWAVATGKALRSFSHDGGVEAAVLSPDGKSLAVLGGWDHTLYVWDLTADGERLRWKGRQPSGLRLAFSRDSKKLASSGWDSTVRLWDATTGKRLPADLPAGHEGWVYAAVALPDNRGLVTAGSDEQILLWDVATRRIVRRFEGHTNRVWCLAVTADGKTLASGSSDQTIRLWDLSSGQQVRQIALRGQVKGLAFSPDGRRLASAVGQDGYSTWMGKIDGAGAQVWETATGDLKLTLTGHTGAVKSVAFAPDGRTLATAGSDGTVRIHDAMTGKEHRTLVSGKGALEAVAFSPDGERIATAGQDAKVRLWQTDSGEKLFEMQGPRGWNLALAFSPDGRTLVSSAFDDVSYDRTGARVEGFPMRLWEVASGKERARFVGHQGTAQAVTFSADGTMIVSGGADGALLLWDLTRRRLGAGPVPVATAWADLLSDNGVLVQRGIWSLVLQPAGALPLLRGALKPARPADAARIAKLIRDLDDNNFRVREKASMELEAVGEAAEKPLREALKSPSAEVRDRADRLLESLSGKGASGERLRRLRAMEVLEYIEHPEANALLKTLAGGAAEAKLTQDAKASLKRRVKWGR
jgi:WD40 repeat protein